MNILALEASTSSAKAVLYNDTKGILFAHSESYTKSISHNGKQDTEGIFQTLIETACQVINNQPIDAIGISGIWHSICLCDQNYIPQQPTYNWLFTETGDLCQQIRDDEKMTDEIYFRTGCMPNTTYQPYTLMHLKLAGLPIQNYRLLSQGGYLFYRLTGCNWETSSMLSGMGFLNNSEKVLDPFIMDLAGISPDQFGDLVHEPRFAPLTSDVAARLGIKAGIPVFVAYPDGALNQVGNQAEEKGVMTASIGTSGAIRLASDQPKFSPSKSTWCYVGVNQWLCGAAINGAGNCIDWFSETFLKKQIDFEFMNAHLTDRDPTSIFLPFIFGERCPGWDANRLGGFVELSAEMELHDLYRGICEGILFNLFHCYEKLLEFQPVPEKIIVSGGIINSRQWLSIFANLFNKELEISTMTHASVLGAVYNILKIFDYRTPIDSAKADIIQVDSNLHKEYYTKYKRYLDFYQKTISRRRE